MPRLGLSILLLALMTTIVAADYTAPRGPDGEHPDLNGIWQALNEANWNLELHMAQAALELRDGPIGPVPGKALVPLGAVGSVPPGMGVVEDGEIPYTPEALAIRNENRANYLDRDPEVKCYLPGIPRATYLPQPFQILQSRDSIVMTYQFAGAVREVYMTDPGPAPIDSWMGWSAGHWDGDTLVVESSGFNGLAWLDRAGNHTSNQLAVIERFTPISPNHLRYEAVIEDPDTFTRPWKIAMPLYRRLDKNMRLMDFKCVEFVEELLYGGYRRQPLD